MSWCVAVWIPLFGALCASSVLKCISLYIWKVFSHNFFKYIFQSPFLFLFLLEFLLSHRSLILLFRFFFSFCFLCCPDWVSPIILSSKSVIHSSALFILLFNSFNSPCISANEFTHFSWFLLIFSNSFLKQSALLFISSIFSLPLF